MMKKVKYCCFCLKYNIVLCVLLLVSIIVNCSLYIEGANLKENSKKNERELEALDNSIVELFTSQQDVWEIEKDGLGDIIVDTTKEKNILLPTSFLSDKLLFYFDSEMCDFCREKEIRHLRELAKDIGISNIILLVKGYKKNFMYKGSELRDFPNLYILRSSPFSADRVLNTPLYLYIDREGRPKYIYSSLSSTDGLSKQFTNFLNTIYNE